MAEDNLLEEELEEPSWDSNRSKDSKGKLFIIILGLALIVGAGFFGFNMIGSKAKDVDPSDFELFEFDEIVSNIKDSNFRLNLIARVCLKVPNKEVIEELEKHRPMFIDLLYKIFGSKELDQLGSVGREKLRGEIRNAFNSRRELTKGRVIDVYFTEFVVGP